MPHRVGRGLFDEAEPQGYKTFSILNSAEHEIYPANTTATFVGILVFMTS